MNNEAKYTVSGKRHSVSSCGSYTERALSSERGIVKAQAQADYLVSVGYVDVTVVLSPDCAKCGHSKRDHFEGKGVCDLGFCSGRCSDYVAPRG